jgi:glycosyltransferase involved in cell wall biosynthesis
MEPDYVAYIRRLVGSLGLERNIQIAGFMPRERLLPVYHTHDILIFPSVWQEPFSITILEGMACGLAVIGTATGGTAEILQHEINGMVFEVEDYKECAAHVLRLQKDADLFEMVRRNGRKTVEERFRLERMTEAIEQSLEQTVLSARCAGRRLWMPDGPVRAV